MGRSKIKMKLIQDHKTRKATFLKRKVGLVKKISELSILCDIKACMIVYESNQENIHGVDHQEIWPHEPDKVQELINLFKNQSIEEQSKRTQSLSSFFQNQKKKVEIQVGKLKQKIEIEKYSTWDSRFNYLSEEELRNLAKVLEEKIENTKRKIEFLKSISNVQDSIGSSVSQEIWDYPELMDNFNDQTLWPISNYANLFMDNKFFQDFTSDHFQVIPSGGVNSMNNGHLGVEDYQFGNSDSMKFERNWLVNNGISSSSTMQSMELKVDQYPFIYNGSTQMPYGEWR